MNPSDSHARQVGDYYDSAHWWYRLFYSDAESLGIHYGFWAGPDTRRADALIEPYLDVLRRLRPQEGHRILDAGCGIGGATLWMAEHSRAQYTGITLSGVQLQAARRSASLRGLGQRVNFEQLDYRRTGLADSTFDGVFTIESLCYAYPDPDEAFAEILRVLKPGGRYVMLDGVLNRKPANPLEERLAQEFCQGFRMRGWNTRDEILARLREAGFTGVEFDDRTKQIGPSVEDIDQRHHRFNLLRGAESLGLVPAAVLRSLRATGAQKALYEAGLLGYGVFTGTRSTRVTVPVGDEAAEPVQPKRRIAILGSGVGACTAAHYLSLDPRNEITLYQMGWRMGGKGASGRNRAAGDRIEEHGGHVWFGFYHEAFRLIHDVYSQCQAQGLLADSPIQTWRDAFYPTSDFAVADQLPNGEWTIWNHDWPMNDSDPAVPIPDDPWSLLLNVISTVLGEWDDAGAKHGFPATTATPRAGIAGLFDQGAAAIGAAAEQAGIGVLRLLDFTARQLPADGTDHQPLHHHGLGLLLNAAERIVLNTLERLNPDDPRVRHLRAVLELGIALLRGCLTSGVILNGFDSLNGEDIGEWLQRYGCPRENPIVRGFYNATFAYAGGDPARPDWAAGCALRIMLLSFFQSRGGLRWRMQAGMGDIVFSPAFLLLQKRGVRIEFFHFVEDIVPDAANQSVAEIRMLRQADLIQGPYRPLTPVGGVPCWPSEPDWSQLHGGEALKANGVNFESYWQKARWPSSPVVLRAGEDFDAVVMGISAGAIPFTAGSLVRANPRWQRMVDQVSTVPTQSFQLWLQRDAESLGWPFVSVGPRRAYLTSYVEPFDSWLDMSFLIPRESWPPGLVRNISYFTNTARDEGLPLDDPNFPERQQAAVRENAMLFLMNDVRLQWPRFFNEAKLPDFGSLVRLGGGTPEERFRSQYFRINFEPSERYVQSRRGTIDARLPSDDSGYSNLVLAGDWTRNGLDVGCVEAAVRSGISAAKALRVRLGQRANAAG